MAQRPGWLETNQALRNETVCRHDRLVHPVWYTVLRWGAAIGAIAILLWVFQAGAWSERVRPSSSIRTAPVTRTVIQRPVQPQPTPPSAPRTPSPEERAEQYKNELRRQYGVQ